MKKRLYNVLFLLCFTSGLLAQATMKLTETMLMHEMRSTPSPLHKAVVADRDVSFMWPLPAESILISSNLDGMEAVNTKKLSADNVNYKIRLSKDSKFKKNTITADCSWAFFNPQEKLSIGKWYWQYAYVKGENTTWSDVLEFEVKDSPNKFAPPTFTELISKVPSTHPRVLVFANEWDSFIKKNEKAKERGWYLGRAKDIVDRKVENIANVIDTSKVAGLTNAVKKNALLTRESRRVVDREEANTEVLIRSYVLTKDARYMKSAMDHITEIISWRNTPYLVGDFNHATLLSLCSLAYDSFYDKLTEQEKQMLLREIKENGTKIFNGFANHLEAHIADNHNWQMNLRIFTMAAFAVYGELPEVDKWVDYSYNIWLARFPGLNQDGGWHNGDSYFHVNMRTLVEVPYFYSRISGYDFFSDPWYKGSAMYVMYEQPPFSKSGGNGSSHQNVVQPSGVRVGYADALSRMTNNAYLADYVRVIEEKEPNILRKSFMAKPGDLAWFRMLNDKPRPEPKSLTQLPKSYVFPQSGLASLMSNWGDIKQNSMLTFRSSPYGSTSHALANQNAYNTFYGGEALFYSSGHHVSFTDEHSVYSHRSSRAHNTILVNGMGQKIGTEGYGWIPRHYTGDKISYLVGDASNAYGKVVSPLWLKRGEDSGLDYTPENGWDTNHLTMYRRHIVELGGADLILIYDELEADSPVTWDYLLHTVKNPMEVKEEDKLLHVKAENTTGVSDAYLLSNDKLKVELSDKFFVPAINWLRADDKGHFAPYAKHWHFKASSPAEKVYRFATIISTHAKTESGIKPQYISDDIIQVGDWVIKLNLTAIGKASFSVENKQEKVNLTYEDTTKITESGKTVTLKDVVPELEI